MADVVWTLVLAVSVLAGTAYRPGAVVVALLVPVSCGLLRMAGSAARDQPVTLRHFVEGAKHRLWRHFALGATQAALIALALLNVGTGLSGEGLLAVMVAVVAGYVAFAVCVVALAVWPILLDPRRRDIGVRAALRLALAVVAAHPGGLLILVIVEALLVAATAQTIVLGLVLPALGALLAACYVLPAADRLEG